MTGFLTRTKAHRTAYRSFRLHSTATGGGVNSMISEMEIWSNGVRYPTSAMTSNTAPTGEAKTSSGSSSAWRAFDRSTSVDIGITGQDVWWEIDIGVAIVPDKVVVYAGSDATQASKNFTILASPYAISGSPAAFGGEEVTLLTVTGEGVYYFYSDDDRAWSATSQKLYYLDRSRTGQITGTYNNGASTATASFSAVYGGGLYSLNVAGTEFLDSGDFGTGAITTLNLDGWGTALRPYQFGMYTAQYLNHPSRVTGMSIDATGKIITVTSLMQYVFKPPISGTNNDVPLKSVYTMGWGSVDNCIRCDFTYTLEKAYSRGPTITLTTTSGSPTATVSDASQICAGSHGGVNELITCANVPAGTRAKSLSGTTLTLGDANNNNVNATATGSASASFSLNGNPYVNITVMSVNSPQLTLPDTYYYDPYTSTLTGPFGFTSRYQSTATKPADGTALGAGNFRFNNATIASATEMYLSYTERNHSLRNIVAFITGATANWNDKVYIRKGSDPTIWMQFTPGTIVDEGTFLTIPMTGVQTAGSFVGGTDMYLTKYTFTPSPVASMIMASIDGTKGLGLYSYGPTPYSTGTNLSHLLNAWRTRTNDGESVNQVNEIAYRATSTNTVAAGNVTQSCFLTYGTLAQTQAGIDALYAQAAGPTVTITSIANGASLSKASSPYSLQASASDSSYIVGLQWSRDGGTNIGSESTASPYTTSWDISGLSNGTHTLSATARNPARKFTTTTITVTITA